MNIVVYILISITVPTVLTVVGVFLSFSFFFFFQLWEESIQTPERPQSGGLEPVTNHRTTQHVTLLVSLRTCMWLYILCNALMTHSSFLYMLVYTFRILNTYCPNVFLFYTGIHVIDEINIDTIHNISAFIARLAQFK